MKQLSFKEINCERIVFFWFLLLSMSLLTPSTLLLHTFIYGPPDISINVD